MSDKYFYDRRVHDSKPDYHPMVAKLINKCKSEDKEYRIISSEEEKNGDSVARSIHPGRMTIVVDKDTGKLIKNYWG